MGTPLPNTDTSSTATILSPGMRCLSASLIILAFLLLLAAALSIPFVFESPSMWYKFGYEKISLRVGKMIGLAAGLLILFQLPLAGRLKFLDRIFSMPGLLRQHRIHAWAIALIALIHPLFVLLPEGNLIIPLELRFWPEWLGVGLAVVILVQFVCSQWRQRLKIAFHVWMRFHRIAGLLIATMLIVHVLYVSESFTDEVIPRLAVFIAAGLFLLCLLWVRSGWLRVRNRSYAVSRVEITGAGSTCVEITPSPGASFAYVPGQFAIVSFRSAHISPEPHAFTLSSTPSRPGSLQFTIRARGDWTRLVKNLQTGDRALIQGPFGRFGHLFGTPGRELIMIAGGIGITPMLSMLRFMADHDDSRPITLIWSNRSREDVVFADEMDTLAAKLTGLRQIPIFTRIHQPEAWSGRLNRAALETMLHGCSRKSVIFICGPQQMMQQVKIDLNMLGFPARALNTEAFGF